VKVSIEELRVRGLGVIEDVSLVLAPGLTVVTGETGAGKTLIVTALQLLLGVRADASLVRAGDPAALIEARVVPVPLTAGDWASEGDDELVVAREIPSDGRSRARIGGRLAPASALDDVLGTLVDVHTQGEHARLARADVQRTLLDRAAGDAHLADVSAYRAVHAAWREAQRELDRLTASASEQEREADRLAYEIDEIDRAGLDADTDARLDEAVRVLENADALAGGAVTAAAALGSEGSGETVGAALAALRPQRGTDPALDELLTRLEDVAAEMTDLAGSLRGYAERVDHDPERLASLRERQHLVRSLERKYGNGVAAILEYAAGARDRRAALTASADRSGELDADIARLGAEVIDRAQRLRATRTAAAAVLSRDVERHLAELGMPQARVDVAVTATEVQGADGADAISLQLAPNPGEPMRPLASAASGGERSRAALAIEVALADADETPVLVFDEVDAGVGGATALAVGEKLSRLAVDRQVLVVTHLAQLAAFADVHHVVEKGIAGGRTVTTVRRVADSARADEIARMLSGSSGDAARSHALELLADADRRRAGASRTSGRPTAAGRSAPAR